MKRVSWVFHSILSSASRQPLYPCYDVFLVPHLGLNGKLPSICGVDGKVHQNSAERLFNAAMRGEGQFDDRKVALKPFKLHYHPDMKEIKACILWR